MADRVAAMWLNRQYGGANVFLANCPSRTVLETLTTKWSTLTMSALSDGPSAVRREILVAREAYDERAAQEPKPVS